MRGDNLSEDAYSELNALNDVISALQRINDSESRQKVLQTAATFFGLVSSAPAGHFRSSGGTTSNTVQEGQTSFSQDRSISPKEFLIQKQPQTDVERVVCLAYYLTHYRETPYFKALDISKLNTEAAQPKFSNAGISVNNATLRGYLAQGTKGNKQVSAQGELFVQALPDREAARAIMAAVKPKRRRRVAPESTTTDQESGSK